MTVALVIVSREVGFGIVLFLARMMTLDASQLEAARIDGAGWFQRLRYVILPEIRWTIEFYVVVASITMLAWVFSYVYTLTQGGPGHGHDHDGAVHLQRRRGAVDARHGLGRAAVLLVATSILIALLFIARGAPRARRRAGRRRARRTRRPAAPRAGRLAQAGAAGRRRDRRLNPLRSWC